MTGRTASRPLAALTLILLLGGCAGYVPLASNDNFAYLYGRGAANIRLEARIYRTSADHAVIFYKLRTADLLYKGTGGGGPYAARVMMGYESLPGLGSKQLLDSASTSIKDQSMKPDEDKELIGSMPLRLRDDHPFVVRLTAHDLNRDAQSTVILRVEPGPSGLAQAFLPMAPGNLPWFTDHVRPGTTLVIKAESLAGRTLTVGHYPPVKELPAPVFVNAPPPALDAPPDSSFTVQVGADGRFTFTAAAHGFYHFRPDTASKEGYTLFVPVDNYPEITTAGAMLPPLRYITSSKEWEAITTAPDVRKEVERFWLDAAGSRDRARAAIAAYYGRVESANRYFTSYTEGWKTDRGLVHIIFGTPTTIRKDDKGETWIYGDESNLMSLAFTFRRRQEPFSDNDLVLQRDGQLKGAWYRNVESWRNGRVLQ